MERRQKTKGAMEVSTKRKTNNVRPYSGETEHWVIIEKKGKAKQVSKDSSFVCVGIDGSHAGDMLTDAGSDGMWGGGGPSFLAAAADDTGSTAGSKGGKGSRAHGALNKERAQLDPNMVFHCCDARALQLG